MKWKINKKKCSIWNVSIEIGHSPLLWPSLTIFFGSKSNINVCLLLMVWQAHLHLFSNNVEYFILNLNQHKWDIKAIKGLILTWYLVKIWPDTDKMREPSTIITHISPLVYCSVHKTKLLLYCTSDEYFQKGRKRKQNSNKRVENIWQWPTSQCPITISQHQPFISNFIRSAALIYGQTWAGVQFN